MCLARTLVHIPKPETHSTLHVHASILALCLHLHATIDIDMHRWINSPNAFRVENNFTKIFCRPPPRPPAHPLFPLTLFYFSIKIRVNRKTSSRMYSQNVCVLLFSCHVFWYFDIILDTVAVHHQLCSANIRCSCICTVSIILYYIIYWVRCKCKLLSEEVWEKRQKMKTISLNYAWLPYILFATDATKEWVTAPDRLAAWQQGGTVYKNCGFCVCDRRLHNNIHGNSHITCSTNTVHRHWHSVHHLCIVS